MADTNVVQKDLGPVSAYAIAVKHGYNGTEEEWAALQIASAENAKAADASAKEAAETLAAVHETVGQETTAAVAAVNDQETASVQAVQDAAQAAAAYQEERIAVKGKQTLASIPDDYTKLGQDVAALTEDIEKTTIFGQKSGGSVRCDDVSDYTAARVDVTSDDLGDGESVTIYSCGKNLIKTPYVTGESTNVVGGVSFAVNDDMSLTAHGTSNMSSVRNYTLCNNVPIGAGEYTISLRSNSQNPVLFAVLGVVANGVTTYYATGDVYGAQLGNYTFYVPEGATFSAYIQIAPFAVVDETVYVQLEQGRRVTKYEPYKPGSKVVTTVGGSVQIDPITPHMTIFTNVAGVNLSVTYVRNPSLVAEALERTDYNRYRNGLPVLSLHGEFGGISKDNAVPMAYDFMGRTGNCTVKWQGSSSLTYPKKNYTIKFDNDFEAVEGWGEQKKYCAKANFIDFSQARNIGCAKLWGQIVKNRIASGLGDQSINANLDSLPNGGAIDGFPIIITHNGDFMGLYSFNIPKDGWMFGMGEGEREAILCADVPSSSGTRFKSEANLSSDFELEYVPDENNAAWVKTSVNRLINACINSNGSDLETTVSQYVDLDSAIDYYIFVAAIAGVDMLDKNYILATYDGVKWFFSAYDMDSTFGLHVDGLRYSPASIASPKFSGYAGIHRLMQLIRGYAKDRLKERYKTLRAGVLSDDNVITTFANFVTIIPQNIYDMDRLEWESLPSTSTNNMSQIADYYHRRMAVIDAEIEAM